MPLPPGPVTSRRAALAAGAGGLLTAGCGTPVTPSAVTSTAAADLDAALATEAAVVAAAMLSLVRTASRGRPDVRRRLAPLVALHEAHLAVLPDPGPGQGADVAGTSEQVLRTVLLREGAAARRVRGLALEARSGPLARLLASMAAGVAAHVEDLR